MPRNVAAVLETWSGPLNKLVSLGVPAVFFLTPLIFAPFTTEALEMNKQLVALLLILVVGLGWLGQQMAAKQLSWRGGWLMSLAPLGLLMAGLFSACLSVSSLESWLGYGGQEYVSFLTLAMCVVFYFALVNTGDAKLIKSSLLALLISTGIVTLLMLLTLPGLYLLPFAFTHQVGFNTIGNTNAFMAWLIPVVMLGLGLLATEKVAGRGWQILIGGLALALVFLLVAVDFWALWVAVIVGSMALIVFALGTEHVPNVRNLAVPGIMIVIAVLFLLIKTPLHLKLPIVVSPSTKTSWSIAEQTLHEGTGQLFFGTGPGTYDLNYAKFKPAEVNTTYFWNTRFDRAQAHPMTLLTTTGVVGLVAWVVMVLAVGACGIGGWLKRRDSSDDSLQYVLLVGWLSLLSLQVLSASNMSLTVLFWGLSGLLVAASVTKEWNESFKSAPRLSLGLAGGLTLFVVLGAVALYSSLARESAEMAFAKAARMNAAGATPQELVDQMTKAVKRDGLNPVYQRNLATAYLAQAGVIVSEGLKDQEFGDEDRAKLASASDAAIKASAKAASLSPADGLNWSTNGLVYRELMPFVQNAQNYAASMYLKALELEPNNVVYQTDLGRVYLAVADRAQQVQDLKDVDKTTKETAATNEIEDLRLAAEAFEKATRLKPDYAPAHYYLAATYERQGKLTEAADRLAKLTQAQPKDVGLGFQLSVIYLKLNKTEAAEAELERILEIYPDYSNAMWYLAAIKANKKDATAALDLLRRVEKLNPDNEIVKESIANLEAGGATSSVPEPIDEVTEPTVPTPETP